MKPEFERRRYADVPKPKGGERWTDKLAARAALPQGNHTWRWIALLWVVAAVGGAAYGAGWLIFA